MLRPTLLALLFLAAPVAAHAQADASGWLLTVRGELASFRGAARDTLDPDHSTARPGAAGAYGIGVSRRWSDWTADLEAMYLPSRIEVSSAELQVRDRTTTLARIRLAPSVGRRLGRMGPASSLWISAGPTVDNWSLTSSDGRWVLGGQARLLLAHRMGGLLLENSIALGISKGPFGEAELPAGYSAGTLTTVTIGMNLGFGL